MPPKRKQSIRAKQAADKRRKIQARENETEEATTSRQERDRTQAAIRRAEESFDERVARQEKNSSQTAVARAREDFEERAARQERDRTQTAEARAFETIGETLTRLERNRMRTAYVRSVETIGETLTRLERNRMRTADVRTVETQDETEVRLEKNRTQTARARMLETAEETETRLERNRASTSRTRTVETVEETETRLNRNRNQTAAAREEESFEERAMRQNRDRVRTAVTRRNRRPTTDTYAGEITSGASINVIKFSIGAMDSRCQYCGAVQFKAVKGRSEHSCCNRGSIQIPPLNEYPALLQDLLTVESEESRHFRNHIRAYNSSFAFATFSAKVTDSVGRGPPLVKIQGQVYHHASTSLFNMENNVPRNGQIYIYDVSEAVQMRINLQNIALTERIECLLREINPYARNYRMLNEMAVSGDEYVLHFTNFKFDDRRRYNAPTTSELAAIIESKDGNVPECDLKVYPRQEDGRKTTIMKQCSPHADPMTFPLLFPHGDLGWSYNMQLNSGGFVSNENPSTSRSDRRLSPMQYFGHRLAVRPNDQFNPLINAGRLSQQYVINAYLLMESQRLQFIKNNQGTLRSECYRGIVDHIERSHLNAADDARLGTAVILPASYIGSPRNMQQLYQDAMVISRKVGRPDFFITMTCNPRWEEITHVIRDHFAKGTMINDIPTVITNIFKAKVDHLIKEDLLKKQVLGPIIAYVYTIEFQKRGLPHAHILATLKTDCKLLSPQDVDRFVTAELSDDDASLRYYQLRHMMHGPHVRGLACWDADKEECSKGFPKNFIEETDMTADGFPKYRRRDNVDKCYAYHARVEGRVKYVDNRMVVPHNPYLLKKYDCHINVEYCSSVMAIKYIHKYIHKGHDRARMEMKNHENDEVTNYIDSRYVGPMEAAWRINGIPLHDRSHAVVRMPVHLDGQQYVQFEEGHEEQAVANERSSRTMLLSWFELNRNDPSARTILYGDVPEHYTWNNSTKKWNRRKVNTKVLGRVVNVSPKDTERFFLKLILNRTPGATSYKDLRTHEHIEHGTFREAAVAMGVTECSQEGVAILEEAASFMMPNQFRHFFVYYLIGDEPSDALDLWNRFKEHMVEQDSSVLEALCEIEEQLNSENRCCKDFGLPEPVEIHNEETPNVNHHSQLSLDIVGKFNADQSAIYERIIDSVSSSTNESQHCYFVDGPGGTGKTFLYTGIYHKLISLGKKVCCVAWTGIASILLPCGTTSHRFFNLPIDLNEDGVCFLKKRDKYRLKEVDVIIWDEASMIPRKAIEMIDRTLRDLMKSDLPFGGKFFVLGGDFRQVLPVVKKGTRRQILDATVKSSQLWSQFEVHHLKINMRTAPGENQFAEWLLTVGNGEVPSLLVEENSGLFCENLLDWFFEDVTDFSHDLDNRIIVSPQNDEVNRFNHHILSRIPGDEVISYSIDKATLHGIDRTDQRDEEATLRYETSYLNSITPSGMPPAKLKLKVNCIVMLIRNLSIADGLCNGTRLMVKKIGQRVLTAVILTGDKKSTVINIPRIELNTSGGHTELPFILYRRQFPVRLAYALTINKAQGQTFQKVGIYIERPIFSHGQLYVALSRCVSKENLKIQLKYSDQVENIVFREVLS